MADNERPLNPFSEEAVHAELERTRRELEESRQRRRQANEAFDSFIRSFHQRPPETPAPPPDPATEPAPLPLEEVSFPPAPTYAPIPPEAVEPVPPPVIDESFASAIESEPPADAVAPTDEPPAIPMVPVALRARVARPGPGRAVKIGAGVATLVAFVGFLAWRARMPAPSQERPAVQNPPVVQPQPPPAAEPARTPAATGLEAELVTLRTVWVRVLADGERRIERELAAGQKIPVSARETIVVRAGDAGALRVVIAGQDQGPFGQDGFPATRTFTRAQQK